jgi:hypothetical protein
LTRHNWKAGIVGAEVDRMDRASGLSFPGRDPETDVTGAIVKRDTLGFTLLQKPHCRTIHENQVFQIQNKRSSGRFLGEQSG